MESREQTERIKTCMKFMKNIYYLEFCTFLCVAGIVCIIGFLNANAGIENPHKIHAETAEAVMTESLESPDSAGIFAHTAEGIEKVVVLWNGDNVEFGQSEDNTIQAHSGQESCVMYSWLKDSVLYIQPALPEENNPGLLKLHVPAGLDYEIQNA